MSWVDDLNEEQRREWEDFVVFQREHTLKAISESAMVISLVPRRDKFDIKFALETGIAIMLDKPILAIATPGATIPHKLRCVADRVLYVDIDTEDGQRQLTDAIKEMHDDFQ